MMAQIQVRDLRAMGFTLGRKIAQCVAQSELRGVEFKTKMKAELAQRPGETMVEWNERISTHPYVRHRQQREHLEQLNRDWDRSDPDSWLNRWAATPGWPWIPTSP
jgi:hypothetical protein